MTKPSDTSGALRSPSETGTGRSPTHRQRLKFIVFSLVTALLFVVAIEVLIRVLGLDVPQLKAPLMPILKQSFHRSHRNDDEVFYSLRPNFKGRFAGAPLETNSLGLRSPEVDPKQPGEFRILSLGESSTFGAGVGNRETYSYQLEQLLNSADPSRKYTVINAGVSAYSSFQSAQYLEKRGLDLEPDMVIIYHELADFLPTANREAISPDDRGLPLSDKQLYLSNRQSLNRKLLEHSAIFRVFSQQMMHARLSKLQNEDAVPDTDHVAIPKKMLDISTPDGIRALKLPPRVPLEEREENLDRIRTVSVQGGIEFVVIHPSYGESKSHQCDLTQYVEKHGVPMFEAFDTLHPEGSTMDDFYHDLWHPNTAGHAGLARDLLKFLREENLIPAAR